MDVFLLGAGLPKHGQKPSALKHIALKTKVMDWQISSFQSIAPLHNIHYLGGYQVADVIKTYPQINFTVIPDWVDKSILHTLLKAPFTDQSVVISYSDTIFRNKTLEKLILINSDVVFGIDTKWKERFEQRSENDINVAETMEIKNSSGNSIINEFTGLIYFGKKAVKHLKELDETYVGSSLIHLLKYLKNLGLSVTPFDVSGDWAELNSPKDIAKFILGTKAETLARLEPLVKKSHIGKQISFTTTQWENDPKTILGKLSSTFSNTRLVVRSSSKGEDNWLSSNAGGFVSLLNIDSSNIRDISNAIESVIKSYGKGHDGNDQILIQKYLQNVKMSGVVFTCGLETGSPYYRFNFDDKSQFTDSVTSGVANHNHLRTIIVSRFVSNKLSEVEIQLVPVLKAIIELEELLGFDKLDIEFAMDNNNLVHIFQIRPITVDHSAYEFDLQSIKVSLNEAVKRFNFSQICPPFIYGKKNLFANMPDWNPAEIIGIHPKPLAFSLYRHLITNDTWAQQRSEFGYRDVRPQPLILSYSGQPYVDVRASLNSFIPASLPENSAKRIINAYISVLADNPHFHDKIEFNVAYTSWAPGFYQNAKQRLGPYNVTDEDIILLEASLKKITCNAVTRLNNDIQSVKELSKRREKILLSNLSTIDKIFSLIDDCKRFGTLAFSHAARSGFIATEWLKNCVAMGFITDDRRLSFLKSFSTVAGEFEKDKTMYSIGELSQEKIISKYGHLRPGTYEVMALAYWEDPLCYLKSETTYPLDTKQKFNFLKKEIRHIDQMLEELGLTITTHEMMHYIKYAIQSREFVKFEFTKNLSIALDLCVKFSFSFGLTRDEVSFIEYGDLEKLKLNLVSIKELKEQIYFRKQQYAITKLIELPPVIQKEADFYCFERFPSQPNFITINKVIASVHKLDLELKKDISGKIVLIPQADPGYDWLFGHGIAGLITKYGGANSHMAIRAAEIDLPAALGVGEKLYEEIANMKRVELDCSNQTIRKVQ